MTTGNPGVGRPGGTLTLLIKSITAINLDGAACKPPVDPEIFFGLERVRLAVHTCQDHCPVRTGPNGCEALAAKWYLQGAFSEPTIMGGKVWGAGQRKNFYTIPGAGLCSICNDDYSADIHLGSHIHRRKKRAPHDDTPDERKRDQEPEGIG